ncbi:hypothetical protein KUL25_10535 [Rhodobacteraceae bacterium N5(2021)]|uniref:Uncharacterized protein n=1 Tax=Gymnodinialimonas phycosphaerae TaxID=2841589 RepID=A0A975TY54_9RHOB|nr:hypothetical protein [Gymnodinialimonas phycosphaerae]MBY4893201.1 hypothetical protein [Gymnodinialimonas phycosphaerae]
MPDYIKMILRHAIYGGVIAVAFVGALLWFNVANLWHLVTHSSDGVLALIVMTALCWITFGSVQVGIRIMMMADNDDKGGGKRAPEPVVDPMAMPIPVRADPVRADEARGR